MKTILGKISHRIFSEHKGKILECIRSGNIYGTSFEVDGVKYRLTDGDMPDELKLKIRRLLESK